MTIYFTFLTWFLDSGYPVNSYRLILQLNHPLTFRQLNWLSVINSTI